MWEREASSEILPQPAIILHTVGSSNQPLGTDEGRSTDVTDGFDMEADLPRKLPCFCILTAHDTWRLEHTPPAVCKANNQSVIWPACHGLLWCPQWVEVHTCFVMGGNNADGDNYQFLIWDTVFVRHTAVLLVGSVFTVRRSVAFWVHFIDAFVVFAFICSISAAYIRGYRERKRTAIKPMKPTPVWILKMCSIHSLKRWNRFTFALQVKATDGDIFIYFFQQHHCEKCGFISRRKITTVLVITLHKLEFQECNVFDSPRSSATASQLSGTSVSTGKYPVILTWGRLSRF